MSLSRVVPRTSSDEQEHLARPTQYDGLPRRRPLSVTVLVMILEPGLMRVGVDVGFAAMIVFVVVLDVFVAVVGVGV